MEKDLRLLKEAIDNLMIKQQKFLIRPNDIFITEDNILVQEGKEWIWNLIQEEVEIIISQRRNEKLNTILDTQPSLD